MAHRRTYDSSDDEASTTINDSQNLSISTIFDTPTRDEYNASYSRSYGRDFASETPSFLFNASSVSSSPGYAFPQTPKAPKPLPKEREETPKDETREKKCEETSKVVVEPQAQSQTEEDENGNDKKEK